MQPPASQKDLLHFLGALNYYRTSLRGISSNGSYRNPAEILQILFNLATCKIPPKTKFKDIWVQDSRIQEAFDLAKKMLINAAMLTHPDPNAKLALIPTHRTLPSVGRWSSLGQMVPGTPWLTFQGI